MVAKDLALVCELHCVDNLWFLGIMVMAGCHVTSGHTQGAATEKDTVGEQQLKRTQLGSSS